MNSRKLMPFVLFVVLLSVSYTNLFATSITVSGKVTDRANQAVPSAQLQFINETDTTIIFTAMTNSTGEYYVTINLETNVAGPSNSEHSPKEFKLLQNYPNPLNPNTNIPFELQKPNHVNISIYNILGQQVRTLVDAYQVKGTHQIVWDGLDDYGHTLPAGIYMYQMNVNNYIETKKMLLIDGNNTTIVRGGNSTNYGIHLSKTVIGNYYTVRISGLAIETYKQTGILINNDMQLDFVVDSMAGGTVTDIDGNVYKTVKIGNQWWMVENLKVTHYRNGDPIPNVTDNAEWANLTTGAYCEYNNDPTNVEIYGRLYNWYAVGDSRGLAPEGWQIPSDDDWKQLEMYLGMSQITADSSGKRGTDQGGKLKATGTSHWGSPNSGASNESGFTALPAGFRQDDNGYYGGIGRYTRLWSSTESSIGNAYLRSLGYNYSTIGRYDGNHKKQGFSIRCVRPASEHVFQVGPSGGIFEETNPESDIYGVKIEIPEGVFTEEVSISIFHEKSPPETGNQNIIHFSHAINIITSNNQTNLPAKIYITLPVYDGSFDEMIIPQAAYYNESSKEWESLPISNYDFDNWNYTIETSHLSIFNILGLKFNPELTQLLISPNSRRTALINLANNWQNMSCNDLQSTIEYFSNEKQEIDTWLQNFSQSYDDWRQSIYCEFAYLDITSFLSDEIITKSTPMLLSTMLNLSKGATTVIKGAFKTFSIVTNIIDLPCNLGLATYSSINPTLWLKINEYYYAEMGFIIAQRLYEESNCDEFQSTVTDIDGNVYNTVKIGDQWWMAENLKVTHYRNGDAIQYVTDNTEWTGLSTGAYSVYNNDDTKVEKYGLLYNGHAVTDVRNLAPDGWHVATDEDWKQLEIYLGMSQADADNTGLRGTSQGYKLKDSIIWNGSNESGFTAIPGGYRHDTIGNFHDIDYTGTWWTSTISESNLWSRGLHQFDTGVHRTVRGILNGHSVRCVKD